MLRKKEIIMKERVEHIDVARGIAMLLVILGHCNMAFSMALPISYIIVKTTQKHIPGIYGYKR